MPSDADDLIALLGALDRVDSHEVGVGVVVREMLERMQFIETVDEALKWDREQCRLSPGQRLLAMVVAIVDNRRALYRLPLFFQTRGVELLLGSAVSPEALNDKAMARALDKLDSRKDRGWEDGIGSPPCFLACSSGTPEPAVIEVQTDRP